MKICVVCHDSGLTGAPRVGFEIARYLQAEHEVVLVSKRDGLLSKLPQFASLMDDYIVTNTGHEGGQRFTFEALQAEAEKRLKEISPDLVYVNSCASTEWCFAARALGIPNVLHNHEMRRELMNLASINVMKFDVLRETDMLVSASEAALRDIVQLCRYMPRSVYDFGICIDIDDIRQKGQAEVPPPVDAAQNPLERGSRPVIAMCGAASERKGTDIFFELARRMPEIDFLWIGQFRPAEIGVNPIYQEFTKEQLKNFFISGSVANPYAYIDLCDLFVLTAREDPNPLVVPEAIALGKPVVSFIDSGGSYMWTERYGHCLGGAISADRLEAFIRRYHEDESRPAAPTGLETLRAEVDISSKMPPLMASLEKLVSD